MRKSILILLISLFIASCGASPPPEPLELTIDLTEYSYSPNEIELKVGQEVTFILENVGQLEHELMIGRDVAMHDGMPSGYSTDFFEAGGVTPVLVMEEDEHDEEGEDHEEDMDMDGEDHEEDMDMDSGGHEHEGFMAMVQPGHATATLSFTVTEGMLGDWEMGCFLLEGVHYTSGMVGSLTVTN